MVVIATAPKTQPEIVRTKKARIDRFDLDATLRRLGRLLIESDGLPHGRQPRPSDGPRIRQEEQAFLMELLIAHFGRHGNAATPLNELPPCPNSVGSCRALGVAQALYRGCEALRDRRHLKHVQDLREVLAEAQAMLAKVSHEIQEYLKVCTFRHETEWKTIPARLQQPDSKLRIHIHDDVCEKPRRLGRMVNRLRQALTIIDAESLVSQYASRAVAGNRPGQKRRPILIALMQADLVCDGWSLEEAGQVIDDRFGGEPEVIRDRVRKRVMPIVKQYRAATAAGKKATSVAAPAGEPAANENARPAPAARRRPGRSGKRV